MIPPEGTIARRLSGTELIAVAATAAAVALALNLPLVTKLGSHFPALGFGDPYLQAWQVAWVGDAVLHHPTELFQSNTFWPLSDTLAFSDALIGYFPAGLLGSGAEAALVRYNLLFLFAHAFTFFGAYLLAREVGVEPWAALVAGAAFAISPWRLDQNTHLHVISSGGIPLTLFFLLRGHRRQRPGLVLSGWMVAAWQVSIGFMLGIQLGYLLAVLGLVWATVAIRRKHLDLSRRMAVAWAVGAVLFAAWVTIQARPYFRVVERHPESRRTVAEVTSYSTPAIGFLAAPESSLLWGEATEKTRARLNSPREQSLFPGAVATWLALAGAVGGSLTRRMRWGLSVGVLVTAYLAMGFRAPGGGIVYQALFELAPGWQGVRTPGRLVTLTTLAFALLAAGGVGEVRRSLRRGERPLRPGFARAAALILAAGIALEGAGRLPTAAAPPSPIAMAAPAPQLHLPADELKDRLYMYWSTGSFPKLVNGMSGFTPALLAEVRLRMQSFPDDASVQLARELGIRSVILHRDLAVGTSLEDAHRRSVEGLDVEMSSVGEATLYEL